MSRRRIAVIAAVLLAAAGVGWLLRPVSAPPPIAVDPVPAREPFSASAPLELVVQQGSAQAPPWLERELRYLLRRAGLLLNGAATDNSTTFTLRVTTRTQPSGAELALIAPDNFVERKLDIEFAHNSELAVIQRFAESLPGFLGLTGEKAEWQGFIETTDAQAYAALLSVLDRFLGASSTGVIEQIAPSRPAVASIEQLETITRREPRFARAWSTLAIAYLSLGGRDKDSLTQLAAAAAQRALTFDPQSAAAHAALGIVRYRASEWLEATQHFATALALDPEFAVALEGYACLLADVGHSTAALRMAVRATEALPAGIGAHECLTYAELATGSDPRQPLTKDAPFARLRAQSLRQLVLEDGERPASNTTAVFVAKENSPPWLEPLVQAKRNRKQIPEALRAITFAASEGQLDAATEVWCGVALKQPEFVINRLLRLARDGEPVPLRVLWLQQTAFLRKHTRFRKIIDASALSTYWQKHGYPDVCKHEPATYGCVKK